MDIGELLAFRVKNKCSDLHLSAGLPPMIRVDGDVRRINVPAMDHKEVHDMEPACGNFATSGVAVDGKRCAAIEVLINTPHIAELILKGEIDAIKEAMASSGQRGMQTFDMALHSLYKEGKISLEEALSNGDSRSNLEAKINFG